MDNLKIRLKRKAFNNNIQVKEAVNSFIQPFKEMPCVSDTSHESSDRINAHDLFSHYTADIIREDVMFTR